MNHAGSLPLAVRRMAAVWLLLSLTTCEADSRRAGAQAGDAGSNPGRSYSSGPLPEGYSEQTALLWGFGNESHPGDVAVLFGFTGGNRQGEPLKRYNSWPTILVRLTEGWKVADLQEGFFQFNWVHAAAAPSKGYFWGFLEYTVEDAGKEIPVIMSADGGKTWKHVATLEKPDLEAVFQHFEMSATGSGRVDLASEKGTAPGTQKIFSYVTNDWGKTWSKPDPVRTSVLVKASSSPSDFPCWVAVQNLPDPLPDPCRLPGHIRETLQPSKPGE